MGKRASGRNWRKGVSIAFDKLNYQSLVCEALVVNRRSERVMQKLGFLFEEILSKAIALMFYIDINIPNYRYVQGSALPLDRLTRANSH